MSAYIPTIFLTGRNSTIGSPLTDLLLGQGFHVHSLGRTPIANKDTQPSLNGSLLDLADPLQIMPNICADTLIHTANLWLLPDWLEEFHACGVRRVIAFSSTSRFTKQASASTYEQEVVNKLIAAEDRVVSECERLGIAWTIFRPTLIYGGVGGDRNVADIARLIRKFGFFPRLGAASGRRQPVHARDLAAACMQCLDTSACYNKAYNLSGGETLVYADMVRRIFETLGRRPVLIPIPISIFRFAVFLARRHPRFAHLTPDMALRMQTDLVFDHCNATRDFGYRPGNFDPSYLTAMR